MTEAKFRPRTGLAAGLVKIVRLRTTSSAPALTLIGFIDTSRHAHFSMQRIIFSLLSSFAVMAFCQVFNDIRDRNLDTIAKPDRPLSAKLITVPQAQALALALALITIGTAIVSNIATFGYAVLCLILGTLYSVRLKNTVLLGNLTVAVVSCAMFSYGSGQAPRSWDPEPVGTCLIFLYILGNELYKTALDSHEDKEFGLRTIATIYGLDVTARIIAVVAGSVLALITAAALARLTPLQFAVAAVFLIGVPVACGAMTANASREVRVETFARSFRFWRLAWIPGALTLLLLR